MSESSERSRSLRRTSRAGCSSLGAPCPCWTGGSRRGIAMIEERPRGGPPQSLAAVLLEARLRAMGPEAPHLWKLLTTPSSSEVAAAEAATRRRIAHADAILGQDDLPDLARGAWV